MQNDKIKEQHKWRNTQRQKNKVNEKAEKEAELYKVNEEKNGVMDKADDEKIYNKRR